MLQQVFASPRALEEIGIQRDAIRAVPLAQRRRILKAASGHLAPFLRKRNQLPLVVEVDPNELDVTGMTGGASVVCSCMAPATTVQDVAVKLTAAGTAPGALLSYVTNVNAGAYQSAFTGPSGTLDAGGALMIDGQQFSVAGPVNVDDTFIFSAVTDPGVMAATVQVASWMLLHQRGVDPKTEADLQKVYDAAIALVKAIGTNDGELEQSEDATPTVAELGPRGRGQRRPWDWLG